MVTEIFDLNVLTHHHDLQKDVSDSWFSNMLAYSISDREDLFHDVLDLFLFLLAGFSGLVVSFKTVVDGLIELQLAVKDNEERITVECGEHQIYV